MKLPTLTKTAKHKTFAYQPRHFDPAMEDLDQRVKATEMEIEGELSGDNRVKRIRNVYRQRNAATSRRTDLTQAAFVLFFIIFIGVYYEYGNYAFIMMLLLPFYVLRRMRQR